ncbi:MAG TPA: hypothetical protein VHO01_07635 [Jatrophihabitans sp.]|nr:hypothetical protein [Jatrophihabitans sp.]
MPEISRRAVLSGAVLASGLAAGAGVGLLRPVQHKVATPPAPPPAALTQALSANRTLLAGYDRVPGAPAGLRSDVVAHGQALQALLEFYPGWRWAGSGSSAAASSSSSPAGGTSAAQGRPAADVPDSIAGLAAGSTRLARTLAAAAVGWPADEAQAVHVVPVLASISASLSTHAAVLT